VNIRLYATEEVVVASPGFDTALGYSTGEGRCRPAETHQSAEGRVCPGMQECPALWGAASPKGPGPFEGASYHRLPVRT